MKFKDSGYTVVEEPTAGRAAKCTVSVSSVLGLLVLWVMVY